MKPAIRLLCATRTTLSHRLVMCDENQIGNSTQMRYVYTSQRRSCTKNGYIDCLLVCNQINPVQLFELWRNKHNREVLTASTKCITRSSFFARQFLNTRRTMNTPKVEQNEPQNSASSSSHRTSHLQTITSKTSCKDSFLKLNSGKKNAFKEFVASRTLEFYFTGINKLVPGWKFN